MLGIVVEDVLEVLVCEVELVVEDDEVERVELEEVEVDDVVVVELGGVVCVAVAEEL